MHKLKEHIANLKLHLADVQNQLKPWLNKTAKQEVQSQLNAIVKSSDILTKTEVNIPTELRELKFKLIKELDKYKEAEDLQKELFVLLPIHVTSEVNLIIEINHHHHCKNRLKLVLRQFW